MKTLLFDAAETLTTPEAIEAFLEAAQEYDDGAFMDRAFKIVARTVVVQPDDNGTFLITCPGLPEVVTFAERAAEVPRRAKAAISEAWAARVQSERKEP